MIVSEGKVFLVSDGEHAAVTIAENPTEAADYFRSWAVEVDEITHIQKIAEAIITPSPKGLDDEVRIVLNVETCDGGGTTAEVGSKTKACARCHGSGRLGTDGEKRIPWPVWEKYCKSIKKKPGKAKLCDKCSGG